jgi:Ca2+-binding RTX toxin-like protein
VTHWLAPDRSKDTNTMHTRSLRAVAAALAAGAAALAPNLFALAPAGAATAAVTASVVNGTLTINGTNAADGVLIGPGSAANKVFLGVSGAFNAEFDRSTFTSVLVTLRGGDDNFSEAHGLADLPVTVDGGAGNDTIIGGDGPDVVRGSTGDDTIDSGPGDDTVDAGGGNDRVRGNQGTDTITLGGGTDTFEWDPGDSSDVVEGGAGVDTVAFNGSNIGEVTHLFPNGKRAVFTRNIANVTTDMGGIEQFALRLLGGEDFFTADDMVGTPLRDVRVDLGDFAGAGDAAVDTVAVNGTNRADHVDVTTANGQVDVTGLREAVHITGAEQQDRLDVFTIGGTDTVNVAPEVNAVMFTFVDLGLDQP